MGQRRPAEDRFWEKVNKDDPSGCWVWTGCVLRGYGQFTVSNGRSKRAHRFAYELLIGPVPDGLVLDHLCRNRGCVNPVHLEPVTPKENVMRGETPAARNAAKSRCPKGHPYSGDNLHIRPDGRRRCRACHREQARLARRQKAAAGGEAAA